MSPSFGSQTYTQPPIANTYHHLPPPHTAYPTDPATFRRDYSTRLSELTVNSRPIIQSLSMYAHDFAQFGEIVAQCLEAHIRRIPPWMKLPSFYLLDMISKNIYEPYARLFAAFVIPLFIETYQQVDEATRSKMVELVLTWRTGSPSGKELFGVPAQIQIERSIWGEGSNSSTSGSHSSAGIITKAQVLSELEFTLGQKERAVQANPSDATSQNHVVVLQQLRRLVEAGVSQEELKQILTQLRTLMRSSPPSAAPQPSQAPTPAPPSQWSSQPYNAPPQTYSQPSSLSYSGYTGVKQEETPSSSSTSPAPSVPAGGFANLLSSLMKSGILSNTGTPLGAGATAKEESSSILDEERNASRAHRAYVLRHPVQLSTAGITKGQAPISEMLYDHKTSQCKQCGLRFHDSTTGKKTMDDHLDMHFKQNMKANQNIGRGHSRSWFTNIDDWIHDTVDRKGKGRADGTRPLSGKAAAAVDAAKREAELRSQFVIVPPGDEAKPIACPICKEVLKSEFLEDDEEWVWRNAVEKDERIYHATCYAEASTNTLASRLLNANASRSRSVTPETHVTVSKRSSPIPEVVAGAKRKAEDDHSISVCPSHSTRPMDNLISSPSIIKAWYRGGLLQLKRSQLDFARNDTPQRNHMVTFKIAMPRHIFSLTSPSSRQQGLTAFPNLLTGLKRLSRLVVCLLAMSESFEIDFAPQTPIGTPERHFSPPPPPRRPRVKPWLSWAVQPSASLKILLIPLVLSVNWRLLPWSKDASDPFAAFYVLSHPIPDSPADDLRYAKGYYDLLFIAYHVVFFSLVRQLITINLCRPIARYFYIRKERKLERFGEQGYALIYFIVMGAWGYRIMSQLPTYWYRTEYFWIDYPHWDMKPELKRYYLMQMAYWIQQLLVLVLGLEKPRKDYHELVAHHFVTLWLVGWSYVMNLTFIGNAVYMSMDIPDAGLAFSKLLNYMRMDRAKIVAISSGVWIWANGTYLTWWMKYQIFIPLFLLQLLNLFWYFKFILRVAIRAIITATADDDRSDDEGDGDDEDEARRSLLLHIIDTAYPASTYMLTIDAKKFPKLETDFAPQTPLGSRSPERRFSPPPPPPRRPRVSPWLAWAVKPSASLKVLLVPLVLCVNWQLLPWSKEMANPFASFFLLSHPILDSPPDDPRYAKGYYDLLFIAYHVVFFSLVRQVITFSLCRPVARYFGIRKEGKLDRFGEQGYAFIYFSIMGAWGYRIMGQLPTWWYRTEYFWIDYPHWDMKPELKRYYLMQMAYWIQQLLVLVLRLEKPRKDYNELIAHHFVTIWLVGWSYLVNCTLIGNAVYMSMDLPDAGLAFSKLLNYLQMERAKGNLEDLGLGKWNIPELVDEVPMRGILSSTVDDDRSDDEDEGDEDDEDDKKKQ
ncbi:hypothetical protein D9758_008861 [Tetrapyrgos nigripes]|uniref:CID domain-containing protein n=1 Tax=Tetrapyrgos nigripes TaxID=182062 RepID=A0A8H5CNH7_9AGAR|nr:hypothetical protein D9758_008861 [Tetrapyrgos nigripes]